MLHEGAPALPVGGPHRPGRRWRYWGVGPGHLPVGGPTPAHSLLPAFQMLRPPEMMKTGRMRLRIQVSPGSRHAGLARVGDLPSQGWACFLAAKPYTLQVWGLLLIRQVGDRDLGAAPLGSHRAWGPLTVAALSSGWQAGGVGALHGR